MTRPMAEVAATVTGLVAAAHTHDNAGFAALMAGLELDDCRLIIGLLTGAYTAALERQFGDTLDVALPLVGLHFAAGNEPGSVS